MSKKTKVIIIGLDGVTWKILNPLIKLGKLPYLNSLKKRGASGILKSTIPPVTGPAWATFQTGVNPGKHGVFDFFTIRQNPESPELIDRRTIRAEKIWEYLGKAGKQSLLLAMPISYPPTEIRGVLVTSFMTPVGAPFAYPKDIEAKLKQIDYQIDILATKRYGEVPGQPLTDSQKTRLIKDAIDISKKRVKAFKVISQQNEFDLYFVFFKETDFLQHMFFDGKETEQYLTSFDTQLRRLVEYCDKNISGNKVYFLISDHGFHKTADLQFSPYVWLTKLLQLKKSSKKWSASWKALHKLNKLLKISGIELTKSKKIAKSREQLVEAASQDEKKVFVRLGVIATMRGVYLLGKMRTQENKRKIIANAKELKHNGKPIFKLVADVNKVYHGSFVKEAPDVIWMANEGITINLSPLAEELVTPRPTHLKGDHYAARDGVIMSWGQNLIPGFTVNANLEDLLPTALELLDVPIPNKIDGKPLRDIFKKSVKMKSAKIVNEHQRVDDLINQQISNLEDL